MKSKSSASASPSFTRPYRQLGFTLVEMLVVLAIIGAFSALLLPVFAHVRARSRQSTCLANLKQIGAATTMYAADYDDHLPYAEDMNEAVAVVSGAEEPPVTGVKLPGIIDLLMPYKTAREQFHCPQDHVSAEVAELFKGTQSWFEYCKSSYLYVEQPGLDGKTISSFSKPSEAPLFSDYQAFHDGRTCSLFADGHAKSQFWKEWLKSICISDPDASGCDDSTN